MRLAIILGSVFLLALAALIAFLLVFGGGEEEKPSSTPPEILEGEGIYLGNAIAYPSVGASTISRITVSNGKLKDDGQYTFLRSDEVDGDFLFYYMEDGEIKVYYPSVCEATGIEYSDLYAIETEDGYNAITRLNYLTSSLEHTYFGERIKLSDDPAERAAQLEDYGFGGDGQTVITFDYTDTATAREATHKIVIGAKTVTGSGYYFMVDNRDCVYSSRSSYFEYALLGFYSYVDATLISEGLTSDSTYEPVLTSNFTHWVNTMHKMPEDGGEIPAVEAESTVVITAAVLEPIIPADYLSSPSAYVENTDGYESLTYEDMLVSLHTGADSHKVKASLIGKRLGKLDSPLTYTIPSVYHSSHGIDFSERESVKYAYSIVEIEAVLTDGEDITDPSYAISATDTVRIAYRYTVDGRSVTPLLSHATLDLSSGAISRADAERIAAAGIGKFDTPLDLTVVYTKNNARATDYELVITEILSIADAEGNALTSVTEDAETIIYRYAVFIDGEMSGEEYLTQTTLSSLTDEDGLKIKNLFADRKAEDNLYIVMDKGVEYSEALSYFETYLVSDILYYVTREEVVSFSYLNYSHRDPFYGESVYENNTDGYSLYGLNNAYCDKVLQLIGGLGESSNKSLGLTGEEIVSVGITPAKLAEYGCYAHTVYFELPRGITVINSDDAEKPADYIAAETLDFTLYISDVKEDGMRIVASNQYDIIARVSNDYFFWLDESFVSFWARENIVMTSVDNIQEIKLDIMTEEVYGSYHLYVVHDTAYRTPDGFQIGGAEPDEYIDKYDYVTVNVSPSGDCYDSALSRLNESVGRGFISLEELYEYTVADEEKLGLYLPDSYGTTYFKEFMLGLFYTDTEGYVDAAEQERVMSEGKLVMRFSLKIDTDGDGESSDEGWYIYEFYHFPDANRVLVSLYRTDRAGNRITDSVSDFYISRLAFKRVVYTYDALLNGKEFELGDSYPELG